MQSDLVLLFVGLSVILIKYSGQLIRDAIQ